MSMEARNGENMTPLHQAAATGNLSLLTYECDKHKASFTVSKLYALHQYLQRKFRSSHTTDLLRPKWFIPPCELELQYSSAMLIENHVEYATYCGMPVMIKCEDVKDTEQENMFVQCVESWHKLQHPGLLKLCGAYHLGSRAFMVYEKGSFETLEKYLHRHNSEIGYLKPNSNAKEQQYRMVWKLMYQVAETLVYLHQQNIAHKNLSMDSIGVDSDGNAKLHGSFRQAVRWQSYTSIASEKIYFGDVIYESLLLVDPVKNQVTRGCITFIHEAYLSILQRLWSKTRYPIENLLDEIRLLTLQDPADADPSPIFIPPKESKKKSWFNFKRWGSWRQMLGQSEYAIFGLLFLSSGSHRFKHKGPTDKSHVILSIMNKKLAFENRLCYEREVVRKQALHEHKLQTVLPTCLSPSKGMLDSTPPVVQPHLAFRSSRIRNDDSALTKKSILTMRPQPITIVQK